MADTSLPGYPQPMGSRMIAILNHAGPKANAYTVGGEVFDATHLFGGGVLDAVLPGVTGPTTPAQSGRTMSSWSTPSPRR